MGRDLQFKIHATLASDRMVFPGVVHHGMFCVYGHVVGVQRYEQPNTLLLLNFYTRLPSSADPKRRWRVGQVWRSRRRALREKLRGETANDDDGEEEAADHDEEEE